MQKALMIALAVAGAACSSVDTSTLLRQRRTELEQLATAWHVAANGGVAMFCRFGPDSYRWRGTYIKRRGAQYEVTGEGVAGASLMVDTLEAAAGVAGTSAAVIQRWNAAVKRLDVYSLATSPYANVVEVGFSNARWVLLFAVPGNDRGFEDLRQNVREHRSDTTYRVFEQLDGRWFRAGS